MMRRLVCSLSLLALPLCVTGCGFVADKSIGTTITPTGTGVHGRVHGGQAPVVGATVNVWSVGVGASPTLLATTTSDSAGNFSFPANSYSCGSILVVKSPDSPHLAAAPHPHATDPKSSPGRVGGGPTGAARAHPATLPDQTEKYVYIQATGGDSGGGFNSFINLGAGLGKCIDAQNASVEINEVSTVILANVIANFATDNLAISSTSDPDQVNAMEIALTNTFQTIDDLPTGTVNPNTISITGGTSITIEAAKIYSIANTIASCVNSADPTLGNPSTACQTLFADATYTAPTSPPDSPTPTPSTNTFNAALYMVYSPYANVTALYNLGSSVPAFQGGLSSPPHDWSLGISYSTSAMGLAIYESVIGGGSSSTIDLDRNSRVWFPSNKSGAAGIAYFDPSNNSFNGPYNVSGPFAVTLPQYVALDDFNQVAWITDMQSNNFLGFDTSYGSEGTSVWEYDYTDGLAGSSPLSTGPIFINSDSSLVFNYDDSNAVPEVLTFTAGNSALTNKSYLTLQPTGLTINTTQGVHPNDPAAPSVVAPTSNLLGGTCDVVFSSPSDGNLVQITDSPAGGFCLSGGIATTYYNSANLNQDEVSTISTTNSLCSEFKQTCSAIPEYLSAPEGVAVDGDNEVWIANAGSNSFFYLYGYYDSGGVPHYNVVSPLTLLHDPSNGGTMISPTGIAVDRSGNIWASNATCTSTTDTTCVYTLSEVFGTAFAALTPLSLQANQEQGTTPGVGAIAEPMLRRGAGTHGSRNK